MSFKAVINGAEAIAGSNLSFINVIGTIEPVNEAKSIAENIAIPTIIPS